MPTIETLRSQDEALVAMHKADTNDHDLSPEDAQAFRELIDEQRTGYREATKVEVKNAEGTQSTVEVRSVGDKALHNAMAVHSDPWQSEEK